MVKYYIQINKRRERMTLGNRPVVIAANWKMYKTIQEALDYVERLAPLVTKTTAKVFLAVPFTAIKPVSEKAAGTPLIIGAQNMNDATEGAFTGEIAGKMLLEAGAKFVILGHSERRHVFGETNAFVNLKVKRAFADGLQPIVCVGETADERDNNETEAVLKTQIEESLADITTDQAASLIIAYEPVWAIGTGKTATPELAQEAHSFCRSILANKWGDQVARQVVIQYGGSVKPNNAKALMDQPDIDGALVGGASLDFESFNQIVNYQTCIV